jgi:hypothetical protein
MEGAEVMPPRRGPQDIIPPGAGGIVYLGTLDAIRAPLGYEQRKILYRGMYSLILAKIEDDEKYTKDEKIGVMVAGVKILIDKAGKDYKSQFESHTTYGDLENNYCELLAQIFDGLTQISQKCKIYEKEIIEQDVFA